MANVSTNIVPQGGLLGTSGSTPATTPTQFSPGSNNLWGFSTSAAAPSTPSTALKSTTLSPDGTIQQSYHPPTTGLLNSGNSTSGSNMGSGNPNMPQENPAYNFYNPSSNPAGTSQYLPGTGGVGGTSGSTPTTNGAQTYNPATGTWSGYNTGTPAVPSSGVPGSSTNGGPNAGQSVGNAGFVGTGTTNNTPPPNTTGAATTNGGTTTQQGLLQQLQNQMQTYEGQQSGLTAQQQALAAQFAGTNLGILSQPGEIGYQTGRQAQAAQTEQTGLGQLAQEQAALAGYEAPVMSALTTASAEPGVAPTQVSPGNELVNPATGQTIAATPQLGQYGQGYYNPTQPGSNAATGGQYGTGPAAAANVAQINQLTQQNDQNTTALDQINQQTTPFTSLVQSANIDPSQFNIVNGVIQAVGQQTSNPQYQEYANYLQDFASRYAQILTPAGGNVTNMQTSIAQSLINPTASGTTILGVLQNLNQQAQAVIAGTNKSIAGLGGTTNDPASSQTTSTSATPPVTTGGYQFTVNPQTGLYQAIESL